MQTNMTTKKILTKVRLINWHYFTDCTIPIHGSTLFTGENGTGKSVILDGIQMVLTTNTQKFNQASQRNEDKRNLLGYVRCKTGREEQPYLRNEGTVVSYVALEFFEERKRQFFTIGVRLESSNMETPEKKWFIVECPLESIRFMDEKNRPVIEKNFTQNGNKIHLETSVSIARSDIFRRLGGLPENFKEMLINSMSFVAISDVKGFINKFILPEKKIEIETLRQNIVNYREMSNLLQLVKVQIERLAEILSIGDDIFENQRKLRVNEIMFKIADIAMKNLEISEAEKAERESENRVEMLKSRLPSIESRKEYAGSELVSIQVACRENECHALIKDIENRLEVLKAQTQLLDTNNRKYNQELQLISGFSSAMEKTDSFLYALKNPALSFEEKTKLVSDFVSEFSAEKDRRYTEKSKKENELAKLNDKRAVLDEEIQRLKKNNISYPPNAVTLRNEINEELHRINAPVEARILADFLEIADSSWQNAVEGYLNTQRFYIIIDEAYYDTAAAVYDRLKGRLFGAGLVNLGKISQTVPLENSLAEKVICRSTLAAKYINYILGRVICCKDVIQLKQYDKSITAGCMVYQNHVLRKIDPKVYEKPYIGKDAVKIQLNRDLEEIAVLNRNIDRLKKDVSSDADVIRTMNICRPEGILELLNAPEALSENKKEIQKAKKELAEAENNPNYIELKLKLEEKERAYKQIETELEAVRKDIYHREYEMNGLLSKIENLKQELSEMSSGLNEVSKVSSSDVKEAQALFDENAKTKAPEKIKQNYAPKNSEYNNNIDRLTAKLGSCQASYKEQELGIGIEYLDAYRREYEKLSKSDLISYEEKFVEAKELCETEFRQSFLSKLREHILSAESKFRELNNSLKGVFYGNDSYHFLLEGNKDKLSLYRMIKSDLNFGGDTLFAKQYDDQYKEEQNDLFDKLTNESLDENKVIAEYTDYRSYLDYDIEIVDRLGRKMKLSKTGGEKSGGEKQTPFYVACAASFKQMYSVGETIKLMLLDEPFNNMDDSRIRTMMKFLHEEMGFQLIMAAPDGKLQVLHEYVDGVRTTVQIGDARAVREFDYDNSWV